MTISHVLSGKTRRLALFGLVIMIVVMGQAVRATAVEATSRGAFQNILQDSLEALWTGREYSSALAQRQQTLKAKLTTEAVQKGELAAMMETAISSILDRHQTSRYILKKLPERFNALFSPHMAWEDFEKIMWRTASSPIKKSAPILIKVGTLAPPGTPWLSVVETIAFPEIDRLSDGKILFKIYGGGVMGEDTDVLEKMENGQLDSCGCTALGVLATSAEVSALLLPNLFRNYEEVDYICEKFRRRLDEGVEKKGYIMTALIDTGFFYMFSRNKTTGLEDVKKQKVITWFGAIETSLYDELGITPVPVAVPDTVSALSTGLADINVAPAAWMLGMQAYQYSNYYLTPPLLYSPATVIMSPDKIKGLQNQAGVSNVFTHNLQEIVVSKFNAIEIEWKRQIRVYEEKSLKAFETKCGMKAMPFSPEDQQAIDRASQAVQQKLAGKAFPKDLINDIQKALEAYRKTR